MAKKAGDKLTLRKPYMNPYQAGVLLGLTLLVSYFVIGAGLGASAGIARVGAYIELALAPARTMASPYFGAWGEQPLKYYLVFMLAGTILGGLVSAILANRFNIKIERGSTCPSSKRLFFSLVGGVLIGFASRLANGCTSGQALTGGALMLTGSLLFLICLFTGGYAAAWFVRRQWDD